MGILHTAGDQVADHGSSNHRAAEQEQHAEMADKIVFVIGLLVKQQFFQAAQEKQAQRHADVSSVTTFG